ncbi:hypothetical protein QJS10_CPB04g01546 [Acorus calamus]|uniref:Uncharacterized protein n=1 Tax=Acorus calamus TaxID=4465 RepID=A0AAV9F3W1_ACOCL|nr:hypothetical protein QJS10_CPB04g01546 [Acorus calamus]
MEERSQNTLGSHKGQWPASLDPTQKFSSINLPNPRPTVRARALGKNPKPGPGQGPKRASNDINGCIFFEWQNKSIESMNRMLESNEEISSMMARFEAMEKRLTEVEAIKERLTEVEVRLAILEHRNEKHRTQQISPMLARLGALEERLTEVEEHLAIERKRNLNRGEVGRGGWPGTRAVDGWSSGLQPIWGSRVKDERREGIQRGATNGRCGRDVGRPITGPSHLTVDVNRTRTSNVMDP